MKKLIDFYNSSIGKKVTMSLTGLFLCTFLLEHLIGNLLLFAGEETFNAYSEFLVSNPVIRFVEIFLFASLLFHPLVGLLLWISNKRTRPQKYEVYQLKENTPLASRITMLTGSLIFVFLVVHLYTFFVPLRLAEVKPSGYALVVEAFSSAPYCALYVIALVFLAYHLRHGFQSAFQTLGLRTKSTIGLLDAVAFIFWFIIPLGFALLPIYFYFFHPATTAAATALGVH
ncbi:MAG: succinate dehydrogenase cytochrome b subunit [Bacteroidota bacterium]